MHQPVLQALHPSQLIGNYTSLLPENTQFAAMQFGADLPELSLRNTLAVNYKGAKP